MHKTLWDTKIENGTGKGTQQGKLVHLVSLWQEQNYIQGHRFSCTRKTNFSSPGMKVFQKEINTLETFLF